MKLWKYFIFHIILANEMTSNMLNEIIKRARVQYRHTFLVLALKKNDKFMSPKLYVFNFFLSINILYIVLCIIIVRELFSLQINSLLIAQKWLSWNLIYYHCFNRKTFFDRLKIRDLCKQYLLRFKFVHISWTTNTTSYNWLSTFSVLIKIIIKVNIYWHSAIILIT